MLEADRHIYEAFAYAIHMDLGWTIRLIDGLSNAMPHAAEMLATRTNSKPSHWTEKGQTPVRLMAVKAWALQVRLGPESCK